VGWLIVAGLAFVGALALLSDLRLHHTAATSARIKAILRRSDKTPPDEVAAGRWGRSRLDGGQVPRTVAGRARHRPLVGCGARRPP
jgi:hypothetical protein